MRKKIIIIIILIAVILITLGIVILAKKENTKDNYNATNEFEVPDVETDINVLDKVNDLEMFFIKYLPITDVNSLSNQMKLNFVSSLLEISQNSTVKASIFSEALKYYFGPNISYTNEDIFDLVTNEKIMSYNEKKGEYSYINSPDDNNYINFLSSSELQETSDGIDIYRQYLFVDVSSSQYQIYSSYDDCLNKINSLGIYDLNSTNGILSSSIVNDYKDSLPTVVYKFTKEKDKYYLNSITIK